MSRILLIVGVILLILASVFFFAKILTEAVMVFLILGVLAIGVGVLLGRGGV